MQIDDYYTWRIRIWIDVAALSFSFLRHEINEVR
jgi:hypothetical protein